jgi:signal transduction histidine kinase
VVQTIEDYSDYLNLRGFSVKTGIQSEAPPVKFNSEEVSQAILNLMDNARKYSGTSRLIRVHLWRLDGNIVVEVQDYGIGIPPDELDNIFQPFYRVTNQNEKGGCGLGLYLVAQVMQGHHGKIEVESELGKGSRFRLYFPVVQA